MRKLYLLLTFLFFITSYENLPKDLKERKDANNKKYHELLDQERILSNIFSQYHIV
jgi:chaperonin cofactor prefoldin